MENFNNILDTLTPEQREAVEAELRKPRVKRPTDTVGDLIMRVSEKGAISFYGFAKFPLTTYPRVLLTILNHADQLREYMVEKKDTVVWKPRCAPGEGAPSDEEILGISSE